MYEYGFIGTGNMGSALAKALAAKLRRKQSEKSEQKAQGESEKLPIALSNRNAQKAQTLADELGCTACDNAEVAKNSHYIILGVKPQGLPELMNELRPDLWGDVQIAEEKPILVTMAAGVTAKTVSDLAGGEFPVIRIMPNTPVCVGQGVIIAAKNENVSESDFEKFLSDFSMAGMSVVLPEDLIDAGSVISGCGPAYIYMYIDALAKAGHSLGLDYETAVTLAKATARGSAVLSENSDEGLDELRKAVCSPGGSTIEGVKSFDNSNLDEVVRRALECAYNRTRELAGDK